MVHDYLFLVPPKLVEKQNYFQNGQPRVQRSFKFNNKFKEQGINIWDGTNADLRTDYAVEIDQHRLLQYDSCRGLEAWTTVCMELDEFFAYKWKTFEDNVENQLTLEPFDMKRNRCACLWTLIPLTRAIDTIVITINNVNSEFSKKIRQLYEENKDFVEWVE